MMSGTKMSLPRAILHIFPSRADTRFTVGRVRRSVPHCPVVPLLARHGRFRTQSSPAVYERPAGRCKFEDAGSRSTEMSVWEFELRATPIHSVDGVRLACRAHDVTDANDRYDHERLLAEAAGKSKREIEEMAARLSPKAPVPDSMRRLPARPAASLFEPLG